MTIQQPITRRTFIKSTLVPAAIPIATGLQASAVAAIAADTDPAPPEIIDTNVHLFEWPFRKLKYDHTAALVAKLRRHRITKAWAGSFEAILHKRLDEANRRLAEECQQQGNGLLVPVGSVNPTWPDWQEDLRRCHEQYHMSAVRLYPAYHGYTFDHPEFEQLLALAGERGMLVQIAMRLEDERVHHVALNIPPLDPAPLFDTLIKVPAVKVQLINAAGPLLGNADNIARLTRDTQAMIDIAAVEGNGGVGRLLEGKNPAYQGAIPIERLLFGSHAPFFPCESALLKLFESPLNLQQLSKIMNTNAQRLLKLG